MKIAVVGATGHTGRQVVEQALARGDDVIALARHPEALPRLGPGIVSAAADVLDRAVLTEALAGADAVVSALGIGASRQPTVVYSDGIANVLHAMDAHGIRKLAVISAVPAGVRSGGACPPIAAGAAETTSASSTTISAAAQAGPGTRCRAGGGASRMPPGLMSAPVRHGALLPAETPPAAGTAVLPGANGSVSPLSPRPRRPQVTTVKRCARSPGATNARPVQNAPTLSAGPSPARS